MTCTTKHPNKTYVCTLPNNHTDNHTAEDKNGNPITSWNDTQ